MSGEPEGGGFLGRWSARKRAAGREAEAERSREAAEEWPPEEAPPGAAEERPPEEARPVGDAAPAAPDATGGGDAEDAEDAITEEELARLTPVEEATTSVDLRPYLRRGVPEALKRAAMRRMWLLNPAIRDYVDPALDYAWDFNASVPGPTYAQGAAALLGTLVREAAAAPAAAPVPSAAKRQAAAAEPPAASQEPGAPEGASDPVASGPGAADPEGDVPTRRRRHGGAVPRPS